MVVLRGKGPTILYPDKLCQSIPFDKAKPPNITVTFVRERQRRSSAGNNDIGLGESFFLAHKHL